MKRPAIPDAQAAELYKQIDTLRRWVLDRTVQAASALDRSSDDAGLIGSALQFVSPDEAARFLGVSRKTLSNWRSLGSGPAFVKVGGKVAYPSTSLLVFAQGGRWGNLLPTDHAS